MDPTEFGQFSYQGPLYPEALVPPVFRLALRFQAGTFLGLLWAIMDKSLEKVTGQLLRGMFRIWGLSESIVMNPFRLESWCGLP